MAFQAISVSPTGVNVNSQGVTSVFLTFGGLKNMRPAEATWCGQLISADPDLGMKCDPNTIYGRLPARYDQSKLSGNNGYTDIMSVPASIARRAYQAAQAGEESRFFYVRRFVSTVGGQDQYVPVTLRLTGGGARVPLSLTDVKLQFADVDAPVLFIKAGEKLPTISADITYTGTGRLKGRWEVVLPGEDAPQLRDLLSQASLPAEERGLQRSYTELSRFNVFLSPTGKYTLPGPDVSRLPNTVQGQYLLLLRIEASEDRENGSNLAAVGAGTGTVSSGAVTGVPLPVLRYYINGEADAMAVKQGRLLQLLPMDNSELPMDKAVVFTWTMVADVGCYSIEVTDLAGKVLLSAMLQPGMNSYRAPIWLKDKAADGNLRWHVISLDKDGKQVAETPWRTFRFVK
jgi:hypothetical protein